MKVNNPNNLPTIPIKDLKPTQGNLKELSEVNYNKLKRVIDKRGFSVPVYIWEDKEGIKHLLDGHGRYKVLTTEGWEEPIPYLKIPAKDLKEAMSRLLEITSQYQEITQEGIDEFIAKYELLEAEVYEYTNFDAMNYLEDDNEETGIKDNYSRKIEAPIYEIKGEKPNVEELFNNLKAEQLIKEIEEANLPEEVKSFLKLAAYRHTIFNYSKIAEFYANSDKDTQALMEKSALVIIDFDKAIENGFIRLSEKIIGQYTNDYK
jgi:hypothetical protein